MKLIPEPIRGLISEKPGVYLVGGTVRDQLLSRPTADWDLVAEKDVRDLARAVARAAGSRVVVIGKQEQCVYRIVSSMATFDLSQIQGRSIGDDLLRRDFTINAMAVDLHTNRLVDPAGGQRDLAAKTVRMTGQHVLDADPLRLLRAFRMAAVLDFSIDPDTLAAVAEKAHRIREAAGERIRDEWRKILQTQISARWIARMDKAGLLGAIFPELAALKGCGQNRFHDFDVFDHTLAVYGYLERMLHQNTPALGKTRTNPQLLTRPGRVDLVKHAALLHDIGKPQTRTADQAGAVHFYHHPSTGAEMAQNIGLRLRFSNADAGYVIFLIRHHLRPLFLYMARQRGKMTDRAVTRFFIRTRPQTPDLLMLAAADMMGKKQTNDETFIRFAADLIQRYLARHLPASRQPPLLTGHDLIRELELAPSPLFARILAQIEENRLCGNLSSRDQALAMARKIIETQKDA